MVLPSAPEKDELDLAPMGAASAGGEMASFSLSTAVATDADVRTDETIMLTIDLDGETVRARQRRMGVCCGILLLPWSFACCIPQLCVALPMYKQGAVLARCKLILTDKAIYLQYADRDLNQSSACALLPQVLESKRCPYESIQQVGEC
jgi:hypothetical protein